LALLGRRHPPRITRYAVPGVRETCTSDAAIRRASPATPCLASEKPAH